MPQKISNSNLLPSVVSNAFDFLSRSVDELEKFPKYSVIHFHAAVELFLKARLMHEHWSLIIGKSNDPDLERFLVGDFHSVSLEEAASRLRKIVRSGLTDRELNIFRSMTQHRNKMVHFFHEADSKVKNSATLQSIVKQQLNAWYLLHQILTIRWNDVFKGWSKQISDIDQKLRGHHEFLRVIFTEVQEQIKSQEKNGITFQDCPSCGFKSQGFDNETMDTVQKAECLVCKFTDRYLTAECSSCGHVVRFLNEGHSVCANCEKKFEPDDLVDLLQDKSAQYVAYKDGDDSWDVGNCSDCEGFHTVVRVDDEYICANCLGHFYSLERCEWCNEQNTGDMSESFLSGCSHCDGRDGWGYD